MERARPGQICYFGLSFTKVDSGQKAGMPLTAMTLGVGCGLSAIFSGWEGFSANLWHWSAPRVHPTQCSRSPAARSDTTSLNVREGLFGDKGGILKNSRRVKQASCLLGRGKAGFSAPLSGFLIESDRACSRHPAREGAGRRHSCACAPRNSQLDVSALPVPVLPGSFESGRPSPRKNKTCLHIHRKQRRNWLWIKIRHALCPGVLDSGFLKCSKPTFDPVISEVWNNRLGHLREAALCAAPFHFPG
jgi:hypothetical protein